MPPAIMPTVEMRNMPPNISDMGLFDRVNMKTIIPMDATIMTAGSSFITMLPGITLGTSGGGSRCTSPPG
ncbi:hypothetical protein GCM10023148_40350 [Actinokineospora soli]